MHDAFCKPAARLRVSMVAELRARAHPGRFCCAAGNRVYAEVAEVVVDLVGACRPLVDRRVCYLSIRIRYQRRA